MTSLSVACGGKVEVESVVKVWSPHDVTFTTRHHPYDVITSLKLVDSSHLIDRSHDLLLNADWSICTT